MDFIKISLSAIRVIIADGKSVTIAYFLCELVHAAVILLLACAEYIDHTSRNEPRQTQCVGCTHWQTRFFKGVHSLLRSSASRKNQEEIRESVQEILQDPMLSDSPSSALLKEQLIRVRDLIEALDTDQADRGTLFVKSACSVVLIAKSAVTPGMPSGLGKVLAGALVAGARMYTYTSRREFARKLMVLETHKVQKHLRCFEMGAFAYAEEQAFKRSVRDMQNKTLERHLRATHWQVLVGWVDFLASLIFSDWSCTSSRLPPQLVEWIVRGDAGPAQDNVIINMEEWDQVDPDRLVGLQQLAAFGDGDWERGTVAAALNHVGATLNHVGRSGHEALEASDDWSAGVWKALLTEAKNPINTMISRIGDNLKGQLSSETQNPVAWLHLLVSIAP